MDFRILGPLEARDGDRVVSLGGAKQRGVLAILLTRSGEVVSRDRLIDELWGGEPPSSAVSILQTYVSHLRKALGHDVLVTRASGYAVDLENQSLDLQRFEQLLDEARGKPPDIVSALLREALGLWRGPALADFAYEAFAQGEIARLEELRLVALERRIEADLEVGRQAELIGELEGLVAKHPLRERLRALLMLSLYRAGRQAEALDGYQAARRALVDELGIEPGPELQELERAILRHDAGLAGGAGAATARTAPEPDEELPSAPERSILVVPQEEPNFGELLRLAASLARRPPRELILARLVATPEEIAGATVALGEHQGALEAQGIRSRFAAFTSAEPGQDVVLIASEQPTDLVLLDAPTELVSDGEIGDDLKMVLAEAPCDVALLVVRTEPAPGGPVMVPFSGAEHDWSAIEIAAWMSRSLGLPLRLVGTTADPVSGRRDASRLLARASLMVQQVVGISTEPHLVDAGDRALVEAAADAGLLVVGLSPRWRQEGLGGVRLALAREARPPTLLVRRGLRPSGLAPRDSVTRFTWTLSTGRA
jgi:DNA-binding SARP family transcriptional activator